MCSCPLPSLHSQKRHRLVASCQFYRLVATCWQVATSLWVSSSCNKLVKIRLVATCHLQTCYSLLKQLASSLLKQFASSLSGTTCIKLVGSTMLLQVVKTDLLQVDIISLHQVVGTTWIKLVHDRQDLTILSEQLATLQVVLTHLMQADIIKMLKQPWCKLRHQFFNDFSRMKSGYISLSVFQSPFVRLKSADYNNVRPAVICIKQMTRIMVI